METHDGVLSDAEILRREFDAHFQKPFVEKNTEHEDFLVVDVDGLKVSVAAKALAGVVTKPVLTQVSSTVPGFLGLATVLGELAPVFCLQSLLDGGLSHGAPPYALILRQADKLALTFDKLHGYVRLEKKDIVALEAGAGTHLFLSDYGCRLGDDLVPVLNDEKVVSSLQETAGRKPDQVERT